MEVKAEKLEKINPTKPKSGDWLKFIGALIVALGTIIGKS